jgi:predicted HTH transcriptional regulator
MGQLAILKTIAAFMNSEGGTLIVGVDDSGNILGVEKDYETFSDNIVLIESSQSVGTRSRKQ